MPQVQRLGLCKTLAKGDEETLHSSSEDPNSDEDVIGEDVPKHVLLVQKPPGIDLVPELAEDKSIEQDGCPEPRVFAVIILLEIVREVDEVFSPPLAVRTE